MVTFRHHSKSRHKKYERNKSLVEDEFGDLLFACVRLAHNLNINPESALRNSNARFENNFEILQKK